MALNPAKVAQAAKIDALIADLKAKRDLLQEHMRAEAAEGTTIVEHKGVKYVVTATPKTELDAKAFQAAHPYAEFPEFYKTDPTFSAALVKEKDREGYTQSGTTAISLKVAN